MTPEGRIQAVILEWAKYAPGVDLSRNRVAEAGKGKRKIAAKDVGAPDLLGWIEVGVMHGVKLAVVLGIEVKHGTNDLSEAQRDWGNRLERAGGCFVVAWSLQDAIDGVNGFQQRVGPQFGI